MKSIALTLLLCGIAYSAAAPECTNDEYLKCSDGLPEPQVVTSEAQLDANCKTFYGEYDCEMNLVESCPDTSLPDTREDLIEYKRRNDIFCDKKNPLRKKFLDNVSCLNAEMEDIMSTCNEQAKNESEKNDTCKKVVVAVVCRLEKVMELCGDDAFEAYSETQNLVYELNKHHCL